MTDLLAVLLEGDDAGGAAVYACGPPAMLEAVRGLCAERGVPGELAMESPMACGFGACFGCAVPLAGGGYMRLCVDGPVVRGGQIETAIADRGGTPATELLRVSSSSTRCSTARGRSTRSPPGARSATRWSSEFPFSAFVSKTITLEPRAGNPPPRLWETPAGLINSIGLPNKGLEGFLAAGPAASSRSCRCR